MVLILRCPAEHRIEASTARAWTCCVIDGRECPSFAAVRDPLHGERHLLTVRQVDGPAGSAVFVAGGFSNTVWGFYVPEEGNAYTP
jgi:hypothetical protein